MEMVISASKRYLNERDEFIVKRFTELTEAGSDRMATYRQITSELKIPMNEANVRKVLVRRGVKLEPAKHGRKPKELA